MWLIGHLSNMCWAAQHRDVGVLFELNERATRLTRTRVKHRCSRRQYDPRSRVSLLGVSWRACRFAWDEVWVENHVAGWCAGVGSAVAYELCRYLSDLSYWLADHCDGGGR